MITLDDYFVVLMNHDRGKTVLRTRVEPADQWSTWRHHDRLDKLGDHGNTADLGLSPKGLPIFENGFQLALTKIHQQHFDNLLEKELPLFDNMDPVALFSFLACDQLEKELHGVDEPLRLQLENDKGSMRCPLFLPFYSRRANGLPIIWFAIDVYKQTSLPPGVHNIQPSAVWDEVSYQNARRVFRDVQDELRKAKKVVLAAGQNEDDDAQFLTAELMIKLQEKYFSEFPDTTYLPLTSLNFHNRSQVATLRPILCFTLPLRTVFTSSRKRASH